ncbi:hypothetical protein MRB53_019850 [Persea americana]|uniref:Uncharacterized protein n=1 Tax=Persea americana TaxID=3435 RepID=A0ACC2KZW9_PERAE|nr:hypothetical protein MRB53_019850 [Persea americana]
MRSSWCAEIASKAYIDTIKAIKQGHLHESGGVSELFSAMAAGYKAQLIVEAWARGSDVDTSVGLAIASGHNSGRHVCVVPDERSRLEYVDATRQAAGVAPEVVVGEAEEVMGALPGVDFMLVDCRRKDFAKLVRSAKVSTRGAVLVCKGTASLIRGNQGFRWHGVLGSGTRVVRSVYLPVGKGVEIAQVRTGGGLESVNGSRWIKHVDRETGEEHVFRR